MTILFILLLAVVLALGITDLWGKRQINSFIVFLGITFLAFISGYLFISNPYRISLIGIILDMLHINY